MFSQECQNTELSTPALWAQWFDRCSYLKGPIVNQFYCNLYLWWYIRVCRLSCCRSRPGFLKRILCEWGEALSLLVREADYQERAVLPAVHSTPAPNWGDPAQNTQPGTLGWLQPSTRPPALGHRAGDDPGWPGVHWLILNRQKCVWLTFVLLMFHSVVFFLTMATLTSRQNTYFSSRSHRCCHAQWVILVDRACSFQVEVFPSPTRYHLQSFLS